VTVRFLEIAEIELDQAIQWYKAQALGLDNAFLIEVLSAADRIALCRGMASARRRCSPLPPQPVPVRADLHPRQRRHLGAGGRALAPPAGLLARSAEAMTCPPGPVTFDSAMPVNLKKDGETARHES